MKQLNGFDYFLLGLKKYTQFSGRATRSEFWYFYLFCSLFTVGAESILALAPGNVVSAILFSAVSVGFLVPQLAVTWRRLHDTNRSGALYFLAFTVIGIIPLIMFYCQKSDSEKNRFGDVPDTFSMDETQKFISSESDLKQLEKLAELKSKGILTEEEFQRKKSELL